MSSDKGENPLKLQEIDHDNSSSKLKHKDASINTTQTEFNNPKEKENTTSASGKSSTSTGGDGQHMPQATTPATRANLEPSATVKFVLVPMNQVVTLACSLRMTFRELRQQFSSDLKMDAQHLTFINGKDRKKRLFIF